MKKSILSCMLMLVGAGLFAAFTPTSITAQADSLPILEGPASEWIDVGNWQQQSMMSNSAESISAPLTTTATITISLGGSCPGIKQASVWGATPAA